MSPRAAAEFGRQWPALQRRLRSFLGGKGVPASEIDDLVQEVAARLISFWHKVDADRPLWPLTATIALNLLRDRSRRPEAELVGELAGLAGSNDDVADAGMARLELAAVVRAMDSLTPSQRTALLQAIEPDGERSTAAEKMLRMRARRRLANAVGRACGGLALKTRRLSDALNGFLSKADGVAQALACATCLFVASTGSAALYLPPLEGYEPDLEVVAPIGPQRQSDDALLAVPNGEATATSVEQLKPTRRAGSSEINETSGSSGKVAEKGSASTPGAEGGAPTSGLGVSDAPGVPSQPPVPAPRAPEAPEQPPVEPPTVEPEPPTRVPVEPSDGDEPIDPVGTVTELLK